MTLSASPAPVVARTAARAAVPVERRLQRLEGRWLVAPDPGNAGRAARWFDIGPAEAARETPIPAIIQQVFPGYHGVAWYWHHFTPRHEVGTGQRALLRFGAVDYLAEVWLNGVALGGHEGGETPFTLDATAALRAGRDNLLAVRVLNPIDEPIDGITLAETPHRTKRMEPLHPPIRMNHGGMMGEVDLLVVPEVRLEDVCVRPDSATGRIAVLVTVHNNAPDACPVHLAVEAGPAADGAGPEAYAADDGLAPPGTSEHSLTLTIAQPRLWELEAPFLYRVLVRLTASDTGGTTRTDEYVVRCGFRDFRLVGGFFHLNGRRVFLRSAHTGNHAPVGQQLAPPGSDLLRRDMLLAKVSGFNCVRFLAGIPRPEQLDLCDEIGLLVYEESYASWLMGDSPHLAERFDRSTREMILRDRNHPCVAIWGLLNETRDGPLFRHAVDALALVRRLDPTRLVLLNSGRFDNAFSIGSASSPGSDAWEHIWGVEAPGVPVAPPPLRHPSLPGAGDFHAYPRAPQKPEDDVLLRTVGHGTRPVFLSEYGMGSLPDVVRSARMYAQIGARPDLGDAVLFRSMMERLEAEWRRYGMDGVYAFLEDFLLESERLHARWRRRGFDLVRSNPQVCGFNVTGLLDHAYTGEGVWTFWREWKQGIADVLRDGWAPLRWCLFVSPWHGYLDRPFIVEAVLATEDVLPPGDYPAVFRISGPHGVVWERRTTARVAASVGGVRPLAVPVLREGVRLEGPPGTYRLTADLLEGGSAGGRQVAFFASAAPAPLPASRSVALWGVPSLAQRWLEARGVRCLPFEPNAARGTGEGGVVSTGTILVGDVSACATDATWAAFVSQIARGATGVLLSPQALKQGDDPVARLPLAPKGRHAPFNNWLYHREDVARPHAVVAGLQGPGILDWDYYGQAIPRSLFDGQDTPHETIVAGFAVGYPSATGVVTGLALGAYRLGDGRLVLNTFRLLEELDANPAADRLLLNLVEYAASPRAA
ncbi:MAG: hypothetical protein HY332_06910 [Chloroflexi bacterium]|nr:hypothetical protein [Chloroflexota bacterium]